MTDGQGDLFTKASKHASKPRANDEWKWLDRKYDKQEKKRSDTTLPGDCGNPLHVGWHENKYQAERCARDRWRGLLNQVLVNRGDRPLWKV